MSARFFACDTETTGLDANVDQIISVAWILCDGQLNELDRKCIYAFPEITVAPEAAAVNGYTEDKWRSRGAVTQDVMFAELRSTLKYAKGLIPLGHNIKFDTGFIGALFRQHKAHAEFRKALSYHVYDTVSAAIFFDMVKFGKLSPSYRLTDLDERFNLGLAGNAHDAMADIAATVNLARVLHSGLNGVELAPPKVVHSSLMRKEATDSGEQWVMARGKHKGKAVPALYKETPDYVTWMIDKVDDLSNEQLEYLKSFTS